LRSELSAGFKLTRVTTTDEARGEMEKNGLPHLMIVDFSMDNNIDGLEFCEELYESAGMPILIIGKNGDSTDAVEALRVADDYVHRSYYEPKEIAMRVRRILSRVDNFSYAKGPLIHIAEWLAIDHVNKEVSVHGETRKLTPTENALLSVLITHRGNIVDADTLIDRVWQLDPSVKDRNALRVHIHRLRNKLEEDPDHPQWIRTERGIGYSFAEG
jgi:DNA-binding response OmpR family regulator